MKFTEEETCARSSIVHREREEERLATMKRRNVLCILWIATILRIEDFVAAEADPTILSGADLSHFQQVRKMISFQLRWFVFSFFFVTR